MNDSTNTTVTDKYKKIFLLSEDDLALARKAGEIVQDGMEIVHAEHQIWLAMQNGSGLGISEGLLAKLAKMAKENWDDLITVRVDEKYIERQKKMSYLFTRAKVPYEVCLEISVAFYQIFEKLLWSRGITDLVVLRTFKKFASLGNLIMMDTFNEIATERMRSQNAILMEMSTPVTQLWNGILLLPLVGIIDAKRAQDIMDAMLHKVADTQSKVFILDISGIAVMDTAVANYILKIIKATKLMGCTSIVSGISGAVARTVVELGIQTDEITTTSNMQDALSKAFQQTGAKILSVNN